VACGNDSEVTYFRVFYSIWTKSLPVCMHDFPVCLFNPSRLPESNKRFVSVPDVNPPVILNVVVNCVCV